MSSRYLKTRITCYSGYVVQAIINNFLPILFIILHDEYNLNYEQLGRIILINFLTQLFADICTPFLVKKIGYKGASILSQATSAIGFCLLAVLPDIMPSPYIGILSAVIVYAFGSGLMEVILSPIIELLPSTSKSGSMAILHSFYSWGQAFAVLITTFLVYILGNEGWRFIPLIWAVIPMINTIAFIRVPIIEPQAVVEEKSVKGMLFSREFVCFLIIMFCAGSSEIAMAEWASMFTQKGLGVNKVVGDLLGPCAFAIFMGVGRVIFGMLAGRYSIKRMLVINNILCALCYLVAGLSKHPIPALIACSLCGFAICLSWPGTYSMASSRFPMGGTLMFSLLAVCGDLGCSVGPWFLGLVADHSSLETGFTISAVFPLLMILCIFFMPINKNVAK